MGGLSKLWKKVKKSPLTKVALGAAGAYFGAPFLGSALGIGSAAAAPLASAATTSAWDAATDSGSWAGGGQATEVPMPQADANPPSVPAFVFQPQPQGASSPPAVGSAGPTGPSSANQVVEIIGKGLGSGLAQLPAAAVGAAGQWMTNQQQIGQADKQMAFQQQQSETGYQRAVSDMQAAGLNPMLAYSQGPESGFGGSQAQLGNVTASAISAAQAQQSIRNAQAEEYRTYSQAENINADTTLKGAQVSQTHMSTKEAEQRIYKLMGETEMLAQNAYIGQSTMQHQVVVRQMEAKLAQISGLMAETDLSRSENMQDYFESWWGRKIAPFLRDILGVSGEVGRWSNRFR